MRGIVLARNLLAATVVRRRETLATGVVRAPIYPPQLPRSADGELCSECRRCFRQDHCHAVSTALEGGSEMARMPAPVRGYIQKWMMVLDAEETLSAAARERPWAATTTMKPPRARRITPLQEPHARLERTAPLKSRVRKYTNSKQD